MLYSTGTLFPSTLKENMTRQNLDQPRGWNATRIKPPTPLLSYASAYGGYAAEIAALPRSAPTTVENTAGIRRPKKVRQKIFHPGVAVG